MPALVSDTASGVMLAFLSMLTYGACMVVVSVAMRGLSSGPGSMLAAAAGAPAGLLIALAQLFVVAGVEPPSSRALLAFALAGIFSTYLGRWLVFKSIELIGPSGASGLQSLSPLITAVFGWMFLGESIGPIGFFGITLGIMGLTAMGMGIGQSQQRTAGAGLAHQRGFVFGMLLFGLASAAAYSASHVFRATAVREWNEPLLGATVGAAAGLLTLLLASRNRLSDYAREIRAHPGGARVYLGVGVMQFIAQALVIASMRYIPASVAALISMCTPLVVMPISVFVLRREQNLGWATVFGICITLAGIALVVLCGPAHLTWSLD